MRPQQNNRRSRGRGGNNNRNRNQNPLSRSYESNGPDVKIRGNPQTIADKYSQLARDAVSSGDTVMAESYFQHAEHYLRIILAAQPPKPTQEELDAQEQQAQADAEQNAQGDNNAKAEGDETAETVEKQASEKPKRQRRSRTTRKADNAPTANGSENTEQAQAEASAADSADDKIVIAEEPPAQQAEAAEG